LKELEKEFSLKRISKAGAVFDQEKLRWMNGHYLKHLPAELIAERAKPYFTDSGYDINDEKKYKKIINFARERVNLLSDLPEQSKMFFSDLEFDHENKEMLANESSRRIFQFWVQEIKKEDNWTEAMINDLIKKTSTELDIKGKGLYFPLRVALFGSGHGPDIWILFDILGKEEVINRFKRVC